MKTHISILSISLLFALAGFQNCGEVDFARNNNSLSAKGDSPNDLGDFDPTEPTDPDDLSNPGRDPDEEEPGLPPVTEIENPGDAGLACLEKLQTQSAMDQNGADFTFNGVQVTLAVRNAGDVGVNGVTHSLTIDGAESVNVNGRHGDLCVRAKRIHAISGASGGSMPTVLIGQDANSTVGSLNGSRKADLVLINLVSTGTINGTNRDIYVRGGEIGSVNGNGGKLYVMDGAVIKKINGVFSAVYVANGSSVLEHNGVIQIQPL